MRTGSPTRPLPAGILVPLATPLRNRDRLDDEGLERLVDHVVKGGVQGLFLLGTTGEGPSLGRRLRRQLVRRVTAQVAGRVPVLVAVTDTAFVESVALARYAAECGADAVVAAPPYYFPEGQPELMEYLDHLVAELPLPLVLYNMPILTKVHFELDTVRRALDDPRIVGLKDSSGDLEYFASICNMVRATRPDVRVWIGPEQLLAHSLARGGHGGVCGGANVAPALLVDWYAALVEGDAARAARLETRVRALGEIYRIGRHPSSVIKGIKCALSLLGICDDFMAEPFRRFRPPERDRVRSALLAASLLLPS